MKKVIAYFPGDADLEINAIMEAALKVEIMHVPDDPEFFAAGVKRKKFTKFRHPEGLTAADVVMQHFKPNANFTRSELLGWIQAAGFAKSGANGAMGRLVNSGSVKKTDRGGFQFVKTLDEKSPLNGAHEKVPAAARVSPKKVSRVSR